MPPSVKAIEAIYHLRKTKSKQLVRISGGLWTSPETKRLHVGANNFMVPEWAISPQSVIALVALGFLSPETTPESSTISYRLTSKGARGKVKI